MRSFFSFSAPVLAEQNPPENPWATSGSSKPDPKPSNSPWEQQKQRSGGGGGRKNPPPIPPFFQGLSGMGGELPPAKLAAAIAGAALILWLGSGLYRVQPEENAVILRFGKYVETVTAPGLHYRLPWPFESALKPNVMFERRMEIGFRGGLQNDSAKRDIPEESMMLTGDANIVDLDFVVQWKIADARKFLFNIRDGEGTLKRVSESAMREVIGQNDLQDIITDKREDISVRTKKIMQDILNSYGSGITVTQVLIQNASVPEPVYEAYEDVRSAAQEAETMRNQALKYRNEIVPRAQGEAIQLVKEAEAYKGQIVSAADGDAKRFLNVLQSYNLSKDVTKKRLYIEAWEYILDNNSPVILDGSDRVSPLSHLNLNTLTKAAQEK